MVDLTRFTRRNQQSDRLHEKPARERHFLSIIGSALSFIMLVLSLALPEWAKGHDTDDRCSYSFGLTQVKIIESVNPDSTTQRTMSAYYTTSQQILISCVLSVAVLTLISSVIATVISAGYPREKFEFLRHYAIFNIVSLLCIVLVAGLWLAVTENLPSGKPNDKRKCGSKTDVNFGYAFYILLVSGLFSLGASSFNLLFARSAADRRRSVRLRFRQEQNRRQVTNRANLNIGTAPPVYSLIDTGSDVTTEAETSMSEPEYSEAEPSSPPPPYNP